MSYSISPSPRKRNFSSSSSSLSPERKNRISHKTISKESSSKLVKDKKNSRASFSISPLIQNSSSFESSSPKRDERKNKNFHDRNSKPMQRGSEKHFRGGAPRNFSERPPPAKWQREGSAWQPKGYRGRGRDATFTRFGRVGDRFSRDVEKQWKSDKSYRDDWRGIKSDRNEGNYKDHRDSHNGGRECLPIDRKRLSGEDHSWSNTKEKEGREISYNVCHNYNDRHDRKGFREESSSFAGKRKKIWQRGRQSPENNSPAPPGNVAINKRTKRQNFERYGSRRPYDGSEDEIEHGNEDEKLADRWSEDDDEKEQILEKDEKIGNEKIEMLTYKDFLLRQKDDITPEEAQKLYDQYKKEYQLSNTKIFFERHKDEEWFREKYCPSIRLEVFKRQLKISEDASKDFFRELEVIKSDFEGNNNETLKKFVEKYELERDLDAFEFIRKMEDEIQLEDETERVKEIENMLYDERHKGGEFSESDSDFYNEQNTASRESTNTNIHSKNDEKIKELDYEKKKAVFSGNFGKNLSNLGKNIAKKSQKRFKDGDVFCDENSVFVSTIPLKVTRHHLEEAFEKIEGFQKICISEPIPKYNMNRFAWITFDSQENCRKALELNGVKINYSSDFPPLYLHVLPKKKSSKSVRPAHFYTLVEKRVDFDIKQALKVIEILNERKIFDEKFDDDILKMFEPKVVKLNLLITYLRIAHSFCYYCGIDYMTEEGLMSRCTKNHPRNTILKIEKEVNFRFPIGSEGETDSSNDYRKWTLELDDKINEFFDRDLSKEILNWSDRKTEKYLAEKTSFSKGRHRCKVCAKMFIAEEFIRKHIQSKHSVELEKFIAEQEANDFFKSYEVDANKFLLENVEPVIPGDITSYAQNNPKAFFRGAISANSFGAPLLSKPMAPKMPFKGYHKNRYFSLKSQGEYNRRSMYTDLDKPPGDGEEDIDYGFASDTMPMFHL